MFAKRPPVLMAHCHRRLLHVACSLGAPALAARKSAACLLHGSLRGVSQACQPQFSHTGLVRCGPRMKQGKMETYVYLLYRARVQVYMSLASSCAPVLILGRLTSLLLSSAFRRCTTLSWGRAPLETAR